MKKLKVLIKIFPGILLLLFFACEKNGDGPSTVPIDMDNLTINNYPKVDGSTSTHPLQVIIACKLLGTEYQWQQYFDGTARAIAFSEASSEQDTVRFINDSIIHNGTHGSYVNLIQKRTDLILVARLPSNDEITMANSLNVELITNPAALDAFIFIVNAKNPVNSLTTREIQDVYTGKITNWSELGGLDAPVNPYQRNDNSGSQELMMELVMKDLQVINVPEMTLFSMMGPINQLAQDENGICYTVYFFKQFMAPAGNIKKIGIEGVQPEYNTIKSKDYKYTTNVYAVTRAGTDENSTAYQLFQWISSPVGQDIIKSSGYVPYY